MRASRSLTARVHTCALLLLGGSLLLPLPVLAVGAAPTPEDLRPAVREFPWPLRSPDAQASLALRALPEWSRFLQEAGPSWTARADSLNPGAVALVGGALPVIPGGANGLSWTAVGPGGTLRGGTLREHLADWSRDLVRRYPGLFPFPAEELQAPARGSLSRADDGRLTTLVMHQVHEGLPVEGAHFLVFLNGGNLIYLEALDLAPVTVSATPELDPQQALEALAGHLTGSADGGLRGLEPQATPDLFFIPARREGALGHRLVWAFTLRRPGEPHTWRALIDAHEGTIVAFEDRNRYVCTLETDQPVGRAVGGVKPERSSDEERVWGLESLLVLNGDSRVTDAGGRYLWQRGADATAGLQGRFFQIACSGCDQQPAAVGVDGFIDFGTGGDNETSNGLSTPAGRATFFHAHAMRALAAKWLDLDWFDENVPANVNLNQNCNAFWDGTSINFFRSGSGCGNTGENRDVIAHEWGHGFDRNDGLLPRDSARGEAISDVVAMMLDRDSCIGESFFNSGGDSDNCSGVRDIMEDAPGGKPLLTVGNVKDYFPDLPPGQGCRGPLNEECHWEGYVMGQAFWHLSRSLLDGVDPANPGLGPEAAWNALERMVFGSAPVALTYAPWVHPDSPAGEPGGVPSGFGDVPGGTSQYLAVLLADDEGDGLANGTPHAAYVNEAFGHHGMADDMDPATPEVDPVPDAANCTQPLDPVFTLQAVRDPVTGVPQVEATWTDVGGADGYTLYRARGVTDGMVPVAQDIPPGVQRALDPSVDPGETYDYWLAAEGPDGCLSPGDTRITFVPELPTFAAAPAVVDDAAVGDGDDAADIGETFALTVALANEGPADASNVTATLIAYDTRVRILDPGPVPYPDLAAGAGASEPTASFQVELAPDPDLCGTSLELALAVEADSGCELVLPVLLDVEAGCVAQGGAFLRFSSAQVQDGGNNRLDPGEAGVDLPINLANIGAADATGISGILSSLTQGVTVPNSGLRYNDIAAGATGGTRNPQPTVSVDAGLACGTPARFRVDLVTDQGEFLDTFQLDVGATAMVIEDDFEQDRGWTVLAENPFAPGIWERGTPVGSLTQPDGGNPFGTPGTAYATGISSGEVSGADISLVSPWLDLSAFDAATLNFTRWFAVTGIHDDTLRVEISGDEFRNDIAVLEEASNEPLWRNVSVSVPPAMLKPGVQLRFVVSDTQDNSNTEAVVDDVSLLGHACSTATSQPALRFVDFTVDDPAPQGNGDGFAEPGEGVSLLLDVINVGGVDAAALTATLSSPTAGVDTSINPGTGFQTDPLAPDQTSVSAPDHVGMVLDPSLACGSEVELVFDLGWQGGSYTAPTRTLRLGQDLVGLEDSFDADQGWTTSADAGNPVRGAWQRVEPSPGIIAPSEDNPFGQGTFAFVTGDGNANNFNEYTVWNNEVVLTSPPADLSDANSGRVSFFHHHREFRFRGQPVPLEVEASNDGFSDVVVSLGQVTDTGGWGYAELDLPQELLTGGLQIRFRVDNNPAVALVDSAVDDVRIVGDWCPGSPLSASFLSNSPVCDGDPVRFVSLVGGSPTEIAWDLDGDTTFGNLPEESQEDPVLTYATWGTYDITLRARDGQGGEETAPGQVVVRERPAPSLDQAPASAEEGLALDFAASATGGDGQYLFEWDFGDGQNATGAAVQNTYGSPGTYTVTLTVTDTDGAGCPQTVSTQVEILPNRPPDPILNLRVDRDAAAGALGFSWDPDIRAEDYNLYGGDLASVAALDPGCIVAGEPTTNATVDTPASGSRFYLVTGRNFQGEGAMDGPDTTRGVPPTPCN